MPGVWLTEWGVSFWAGASPHGVGIATGREHGAACKELFSNLLKRTQEVDDVLLIFRRQRIETVDDSIGLGGAIAAVPVAEVILHRLDDVRCSTVMQEEDSLTRAPKRRRTEHVATSLTFRDPIGQARSHMMQQQVGEEVRFHVAQRGDRRGR